VGTFNCLEGSVLVVWDRAEKNLSRVLGLRSIPAGWKDPEAQNSNPDGWNDFKAIKL